MASYISFQPSDFFNNILWTGTGSSNSLTGVGFQPDFTWIKGRTAGEDHMLFDSVRGVTKDIHSNVTDAEATDAQTLTAFDSDGFTVGTANYVNQNTNTFVGWNWKAGTAESGATTGAGTAKTYTASVNTTAGISITKYVGNGTENHTIPHNLGVAPKVVLVKNLSSTTGWVMLVRGVLASSNWYLALNSTAAQTDAAGAVFMSNPTSVYFGLGNSTTSNTNDADYIAYCFADVNGYSKFSNYTGNGNADGTFVYTGFRPAFVMTKKISGTGNWIMVDSTRNPGNVIGKQVEANQSISEYDSTRIDLLSNGFKCRASGSDANGSGEDYLYLAFAEFPITSSNSKAVTAR